MSRAVIDALMTCLDEDHAIAIEEHRRKTVKKPLTAYAAKLLAKRFSEWRDPNEAADIMIERCWQGFKAEWVRDRTPNSGRRNFADVAFDRINQHGSESVFVDRDIDERFSAGNAERRFDHEDLRDDLRGLPVPSRH